MNEKEPVLTGHQDRTPLLHSQQSAREAPAGAGELWAGAAPDAPGAAEIGAFATPGHTSP